MTNRQVDCATKLRAADRFINRNGGEFPPDQLAIQWAQSEDSDEAFALEPLDLRVKLIKASKPVLEYEVVFGKADGGGKTIKRIVKGSA